MDKVTDRILWSILVLAIGVSLFIFGKPAYQNIIKSSTQNLSHSTNQWEGATLANEQFALGNAGWAGSDDFNYDGSFDSHEHAGDRTYLFNVTATDGVYHMSSDSTMPADGHYAGFYVWYKNTNGNTFGTGDSLNASVQVKGVGYLCAFGFENGQDSPYKAQQINTHGQWQTLTYHSPSKAAGYGGLVFYLYYQPNTDLYVRNVDAQIH